MSMVLFADVSNVYPAVKSKYRGKVNYGKIINSWEIARQFAYGIQTTDSASFITALRHLNYSTKFKKFRAGENWNVEIAMDAIRLLDRFDNMMFVSNDTALIPLYRFLRERGIAVFVIACENEQELTEHVDGVITLDQGFLEDNETAKAA